MSNAAVLKCPETGHPIKISFREITPQNANALLNNNHELNRNVKPNIVASYAEQMSADEWHPASAEAIKISDKGILVDGQHRLHAVIKANLPVTFLIVEGVPQCAFTAIDDGVQRSLADALQISGATIRGGAQRAGNALKVLLQINTALEKNQKFSTLPRIKPSVTHAVNFHSNLKNFNGTIAKFTDLFNYTKLQKNFNCPTLMAIYYLFNGLDNATDEALHTICLSIESGTPFDDLKDKSPSYHVVQRIRAKREAGGIIRFYDYLNMFIWALDKTLRGEPVDAMPKKLTEFLEYRLEARRLAIKRFANRKG